MRLRRTLRPFALAVLAACSLGGCVHAPCVCDDEEINPRRPGLDGRSSAQLDPGDAPRQNPGPRGAVPAARTPEETGT